MAKPPPLEGLHAYIVNVVINELFGGSDMSNNRPSDAMDRGRFSFREILYRILAFLFLIAVVAAVLLIAEDANAAVELREVCDMLFRGIVPLIM